MSVTPGMPPVEAAAEEEQKKDQSYVADVAEVGIDGAGMLASRGGSAATSVPPSTGAAEATQAAADASTDGTSGLAEIAGDAAGGLLDTLSGLFDGL